MRRDAQKSQHLPFASQSPYRVGSKPRGPSRSPVTGLTTLTISGSSELTGPHLSADRATSGLDEDAAFEVAEARGRCARSCAERTCGRGTALAAAAAAAGGTADAAAGVAAAAAAGEAGVAAAVDDGDEEAAVDMLR